MNGTNNNVMGLSEPPEGVLAGESVPPENTEAENEFERVEVETMMGVLKGRGRPFTTMGDSELEERSREYLRKLEGE